MRLLLKKTRVKLSGWNQKGWSESHHHYQSGYAPWLRSWTRISMTECSNLSHQIVIHWMALTFTACSWMRYTSGNREKPFMISWLMAYPPESSPWYISLLLQGPSGKTSMIRNMKRLKWSSMDMRTLTATKTNTLLLLSMNWTTGRSGRTRPAGKKPIRALEPLRTGIP